MPGHAADAHLNRISRTNRLDEAVVVVVEDLERAAAALSTRTAPVVPACGVLVAAAGLLLKAEFSDDVDDIFLGFAVLFAVLGLGSSPGRTSSTRGSWWASASVSALAEPL